MADESRQGQPPNGQRAKGEAQRAKGEAQRAKGEAQRARGEAASVQGEGASRGQHARPAGSEAATQGAAPAPPRASPPTDPNEKILLEQMFGDVGGHLNFQIPKLKDIVDDCDIFFDANGLLFLYEAPSVSLGRLFDYLEAASKRGHLFMPAHAMREFFKNRPKVISKLADSIRDAWPKPDQVQVQVQVPAAVELPAITSPSKGSKLIKSRDALVKAQEALAKAQAAYRAEIDEEALRAATWYYDDPVVAKLRELLKNPLSIVELTPKPQEIRSKAKDRYARCIPPGYQDSHKPGDGPLGDLIIWLSVLQVASARKRHAILVCKDMKEDWRTPSGGTGLGFPRPELIEEYRQASDGKAIYILRPSQLAQTIGYKGAELESMRSAEKAPSGDHLTLIGYHTDTTANLTAIPTPTSLDASGQSLLGDVAGTARPVYWARAQGKPCMKCAASQAYSVILETGPHRTVTRCLLCGLESIHNRPNIATPNVVASNDLTSKFMVAWFVSCHASGSLSETNEGMVTPLPVLLKQFPLASPANLAAAATQIIEIGGELWKRIR